MKTKTIQRKKGFSLVEMLVAISLFTVVMTASTGALLAVVAANRKAQAFDSAMSNMNFVMDHMTRNLRVGTTYACASGSPATFSSGTIDTPANCWRTTGSPLGPGNAIAFEPQQAKDTEQRNQDVYRYNSDANGGFIERCKTDCHIGGSYTRMTAENVDITRFNIYVEGACSATGGGCTADAVQPRIFLLIGGTVKNDSNTPPTAFSLQTSITQRLFDI